MEPGKGVKLGDHILTGHTLRRTYITALFVYSVRGLFDLRSLMDLGFIKQIL